MQLITQLKEMVEKLWDILIQSAYSIRNTKMVPGYARISVSRYWLTLKVENDEYSTGKSCFRPHKPYFNSELRIQLALKFIVMIKR